MRRRGTVRAAVLAAALAVGFLAGCAGDGPAGEEDGGGAPDPGAAADSATPAGEATSGAAADTGLRDDRPLRSRLLRLVNSTDEEVVVQAAAGAGWVSLDTIAAGDSSVVNVESRARRVALRAGGAGGPAAADSVDLEAPGIARWLIRAVSSR